MSAWRLPACYSQDTVPVLIQFGTFAEVLDRHALALAFDDAGTALTLCTALRMHCICELVVDNNVLNCSARFKGGKYKRWTANAPS
jgi:hypothetical protein